MARGVLMLRLLLNPTMVATMEDMEATVDIDMARGVLMLRLLLNPTMVYYGGYGGYGGYGYRYGKRSADAKAAAEPYYGGYYGGYGGYGGYGYRYGKRSA